VCEAVAPLKRTCNYNGNTYGVGEKFVSDEDGKYKCKTCICDEVDDGVFGVTCAQMCTADKIKCKDNEDMKYQTKSLGTDGMCGCLVPFCEARVKKQDTKHKGDRYCSYHTGGAGKNPSNTFCPNKLHWPAASNINSRSECLELCKSLTDCPQADFYSRTNKKCWVYKQGNCGTTYQPWQDYIRCRAEKDCKEVSLMCRSRMAKVYCKQSRQFKELCCETCQNFD